MTSNRQLFDITGSDRDGFLQGLVTNDVAGLKDGLVYAALLSPQGKYLADFFLVPQDGSIGLDVKADLAQGLLRRLTMYRLRADVQITPSPVQVTCGVGPVPAGAFADPRDPALGWRAYGPAVPEATDPVDWDAIRVQNLIPETGIELIPDSTFILEAGFDRLSGVDFRKGCYVGQEVTARMRHKTELRKGLVRVRVDGTAPIGTEITKDGKAAGTLYTQSGGYGIAYLRFDRSQGTLTAADATVHTID
ncbi:folate-binding protein YgfZ [Pseudoruegeria sp. SK021]|uniref:CAF17-like 4Fe-4S cluster assembly/insertion protein YgfZ n=1 Tax=Pseudoruegeria sp. SK021 TaxID=1933035 RepID=UPI000A24A80B|nr:folate-binding protein YgfZ [Pseudoruegeria sp. SK021]OSP56183.1 folate-binding protein YgfZ [Pseudoruegeria sp. SK021]